MNTSNACKGCKRPDLHRRILISTAVAAAIQPIDTIREHGGRLVVERPGKTGRVVMITAVDPAIEMFELPFHDYPVKSVSPRGP